MRCGFDVSYSSRTTSARHPQRRAVLLREAVSSPKSMVLAGDLDARIAAVASRFDLTPAFVRAYLAPRDAIRAALEAATDEADLFARLGPLYEMYVRFALSTTLRGRTFADFISPYVARPRRFLDVGCAYGGFLRAWRERGADVVGVEIEPSSPRLRAKT